jgi:WD40 repeat protein
LSGENDPEIQRLLGTVQPRRAPAWLHPLTASLTAPGGPLLRILIGHTARVTAVAVDAQGRIAVSGSGDETVRVWDLQREQCTATLQGHTSAVLAVAMDAQGRIAVSGSHDRTVRVWDLKRRRCAATLEGHWGEVSAVAVDAQGRIAVSAGSWDRTVRVWDLSSGRCLATFTADAAIQSCAIDPAGRVIVAGDVLGRVHFLRLEERSV